MFYRNKKDQKYLNKIMVHYIKKYKQRKRLKVVHNFSFLPVSCMKIKTSSDFINYVETSMGLNNMTEWFIIKGITKVSSEHTLPKKEYIYCDAKNIVIAISEKLSSSITGFTSLFIIPFGSSSFFGINVNDKLFVQ